MPPPEDGRLLKRVVAFLQATQPARSVANTLLDLGLPRVRGWLREKAGPEADVAEIRIEKDGALVHLDGVRIPLGDHGMLVLDHACATIVKGLRSGLPEVRLEACRGVLSFRAGPSPFRAAVSFRGSSEASDAFIEGDVEIHHRPSDARGQARLRVSADAWRLEEGTVSLPRSQTRACFSARGGLDGDKLEGRIDAELEPRVLLEMLKVPATALPREHDRVRVELDVKGSARHPRANGTLRGAELGFRFGRPRFVPSVVVRAIDGTIDLDGNALRARIEAQMGRAGKGTALVELEADARRLSDLRATVSLHEVEGALVREVSSALDLPVLPPRDLTLTASLRGEGAAISGSLHLATARSRIVVDPLRLEGQDFTGTKIAADIAFADALEAGLAKLDVLLGDVGSLRLELEGKRDGFRGTATAEALRFSIPKEPRVPPFLLEAIEGRVSADPSAVHLADVRFRAYGGRFRGELDASKNGDVTYGLWVEDASAALIEQLAAFDPGPVSVRVVREGTRPANELWLPNDARVNGELRGRSNAPAVAELAFETIAGTALVLHAHITDRVDGSTLRGNIAIADAITSGAFDADLKPVAEGTVQIDAKLTGPATRYVVAGYLTAPVLRVVVVKDAKAPPFVLTDVSALFRLDADKLVWHRGLARFAKGSIVSAGVVGYTPAFAGMKSTVAFGGIEVEHLEVEGGRTLAPFVKGALSATLSFERKGERGPVLGRGTARLEHARFPALGQAAAPLAKYGLRPPPEDALLPATATLELDADGWTIGSLRAVVKGAAAIGDVRVGLDGSLLGYVTVYVEDELLRASPVLLLPSVLAERITLPVRLEGTMTAPVVAADLTTCLGKLVTDNRLSSFFISTVEEAATFFGAHPTMRPAATEALRTSEPDPMDGLLAELMEQGAEWDEIEKRLDEHRRSSVRYRIA